MKDNQNNLNIPGGGIDRDTHPIRLQNGAYTFAKNVSIEDTSGNGIPIVQNEPSNILCKKFTEGRNVIGFKFEPSIKKTFLFIVDTITNVSEIGYITSDSRVDMSDSILTDCNCEPQIELGDKLEDIISHTENCRYVKLVSDECNLCLNLSINHPVNSLNIVFKNEQCGKVLYWTDGFNPPRYLKLDELEKDSWKDIEYFYTGAISCGDESNIQQTCLDCTKLRVFPYFEIPHLNINSISNGGNLYEGTYEFFIAFSDELGNEISNYYSHSFPIPLFNYNDVMVSTLDISRQTNYSISIDVDYLDTRYEFYKLVCVFTSALGSEQRPIDLGVFPSSQNNILVSTLAHGKDITLNKITTTKPVYEVVDKMSEANGYLFMGGLTSRRPLNLQKVVNMVGPFMKWMTILANEEFYKNPVNASKYRSYMRDESYPISFSFGLDNGTETTDFPTINRSAFDTTAYRDLGILRAQSDLKPLVGVTGEGEYYPITNDFNVASIVKQNSSCLDEGRKYQYDFYNTAVNKGSTPSSYLSLDVDFNSPDLMNKYYLKVIDTECSTVNLGEINTYEGDFIVRVNGDFAREGASLELYVNKFLKNYKDSSNRVGGGGIDNYTTLSRYTGKGCYYDLNSEKNPNCNKFKLKDESLSIYSLVEKLDENGNNTRKDVFFPLSNYKIEPVPYNETQVVTGTRISDYQFNNTYLLKGYRGAHLRPNSKVGLTCLDAIVPLVYGTTDFTYIDGYNLINVGTRSNDYLTEITHVDYTAEITSDIIDYPLPPNYISSQPIEKIDKESEGRADEKWAYTRVIQKFTPGIAKNALFFRLRDILDYPFIQLNFATDAPDFIGNSTQNDFPVIDASTMDLTIEDDVAMNRLNKYRVAFFKSGCDVPQKAVKTLFLTGTETRLLNLQELLGTESMDFMMTIDSPIQQVFSRTIEFTRYYSKDFRLSANGQPLPEQYRYMDRYVGDNGVFMYKAHSIGRGGDRVLLGDTPNGGRDFPGLAWAEDKSLHQMADKAQTTHGSTLVDDKTWMTTSTEFSFIVTQRGQEIDYSEITANNIVVAKKQSFSKECYFKDVENEICEFAPYEEGLFAYNESTQTYPDNAELFDSSNTKNKLTKTLLQEAIFDVTGKQDIEVFNGISLTKLFQANFGSRVNFIEDSKLDFRCKPIRHFKFPDNTIAPFIAPMDNYEGKAPLICPIGVSIDPNIVNIFLDLAVKLGEITQEERDSIVSFKIKRGYRGAEKTILSKGLVSDLIKYQALTDTAYYSNFPFNSLQPKDLILVGKTGIRHPHGALGNNKFTMISPEINTGQDLSPTEIKFEAYTHGTTNRTVSKVDGHGKMVILSDEAMNLASTLGKAEATFELAMTASDAAISASQGMFAGVVVNYGVPIAMAAYVVSLGFKVSESLRKSWEYTQKWIESFKNAGEGTNFAHVLVSEGEYNNVVPLETTSINLLRGINKYKLLKDGNYKLVAGDTGDTFRINNIDRENSGYIYLGSNLTSGGIQYPNAFSGIDGSNTEQGISSGSSAAGTFKIANLYASLKVYKPAQYGRLHNISWVDTGDRAYLSESYGKGEVSSFITFGGDTYISKFNYRKKYNYYLTTGMNQVDFMPLKYTLYDNVGKNKYFVNYDTVAAKGSSYGVPAMISDYNLKDVESKGKYVDDGMFFHFEYGYHSVITESEINGFTRVAFPTPNDNFFPNYADSKQFSQEKFLSIREPERFYFNSVYSSVGLSWLGRLLPDNYEAKFYNCINNSPSGIIRSQVDASEKRTVDPWLIFKPNDFHNFKASYGKFITLKSIESQQLLALFEHKVVLMNKIDEIRERITPETVELGTGIFTTRPIEFHSTDLGYGGTQHSEVVSNEFGHFYVDARRGQIFQIESNGNGATEITMGLRNWFKEQLPFKILNGGIEGLTDLDVDNPFKGLGISLGWDSRFKRLFLTKLDYIVNSPYKGKLEYREVEDDNSLITTKVIVNKETGEEVLFSNREVFTPAHFTLGYSPLFKIWVSYYSFYPNFYIPYDNYFRTGVNPSNNNVTTDNIKETGIWSHLLTNKSYGVFYGKKYPWTIEFVTKELFTQKIMASTQYWIDSLRYHNEYDYSQNTDVGLDRLMVYNNTNNSGVLNLIKKEENNRFQYTQYPKYNKDGSSDILAAYSEGSWRINDYFNRVINVNNNVPIWNYDITAIDKTINAKAVTFKTSWLDRLRGDYFQLRFEGGSDTRYKQIFKWNQNEEHIVV